MTRPFVFFIAFIKALNSLGLSKNYVADKIKVKYHLLPYNKDLIGLIKKYKLNGYEIILSTGAPLDYAKGVFDYLGIFDKVISTKNNVNNTGKNKLKNITGQGYEDFIYIGDSFKDLPIWEYCKKAIVVSNTSSLRKNLEKMGVELIHQNFPGKSNFLSILMQLRVVQWSKNSLLFLPAITSHQIFSKAIILETLLGFISFSFFASFIYIINDIIDIENDRRHDTKKYRPIASGDLSVQSAILLSLICLFIGGLVLLKLNNQFSLIICLYVILNFTYSYYFKRIIILDVLFLISFYALRLLSGHLLTGIEISTWLLSFSVFIFFSLGLLKRYIDIRNLKNNKVDGRGYIVEDINIILGLGISSGLVSSLVLFLYVGSDQVSLLYTSPILLILLVPLFLYWISWIWIMGSRGIINGDPVKFAVSKINTYAVLFCTILIMYLSK